MLMKVLLNFKICHVLLFLLAQTNSMNQLNNLNLSLQLQRGTIDNRQLQALAQSQRFHPAALQQLLMNSQNQVSAQAQVVAGFSGNRGNYQRYYTFNV